MQILNGELVYSETNKNANGGTELMARRMESGIDKELLSKFHIFLSRIRDYDKTNDKHKILVCHDLPNDPESKHLENDGWANFHRLVFVSHWQRQQYVDYFRIPWSKTNVIRNAITPIPKHEKPKDKINIIYHTTPHRGLSILIPVFEKLCEDFDDIHLNVYSSFDIYGWPERNKPFEPLFEKIMAHPNMTYHGAKTNEEVRQALTQSHIFAYPSTWPETSCLSLIEALSAKCLCVHSDLAALPETSSNWSLMYGFHENPQKHANIFYTNMMQAIKSIKEHSEDIDLRTGSAKIYTDAFYSWDVRKLEWQYFLKSIENEPVKLDKPKEMFRYKT